MSHFRQLEWVRVDCRFMQVVGQALLVSADPTMTFQSKPLVAGRALILLKKVDLSLGDVVLPKNYTSFEMNGKATVAKLPVGKCIDWPQTQLGY